MKSDTHSGTAVQLLLQTIWISSPQLPPLQSMRWEIDEEEPESLSKRKRSHQGKLPPQIRQPIMVAPAVEKRRLLPSRYGERLMQEGAVGSFAQQETQYISGQK
jgi:hypothetical protein